MPKGPDPQLERLLLEEEVIQAEGDVQLLEAELEQVKSKARKARERRELFERAVHEFPGFFGGEKSLMCPECGHIEPHNGGGIGVCGFPGCGCDGNTEP